MHLGTNNFQVFITRILKFISVLLKLQGSRATPKHWSIEKIFGTDFFFTIGTDIVSDFYFLGHTNIYIYIYIYTHTYIYIYTCVYRYIYRYTYIHIKLDIIRICVY